jgi:RHH-type rel operon transcriptional repressor/antitoxin RelB
MSYSIGREHMHTITIRVPDELETRLDNLVRKTGRTKTFYVRTALEQFIEDREDYLLAVDVMERDEPTISLDELERNLGLAH